MLVLMAVKTQIFRQLHNMPRRIDLVALLARVVGPCRVQRAQFVRVGSCV